MEKFWEVHSVFCAINFLSFSQLLNTFALYLLDMDENDESGDNDLDSEGDSESDTDKEVDSLGATLSAATIST